MLNLVSAKEIKRLYKRFKKLDTEHMGTITTDAMLSIPEFAMNPIAPRFVEILKREDNINFRVFVQTLAPLSPLAPRDEKIKRKNFSN